MKKTIFAKISELYTLRIPNRKYVNLPQYTLIQQLAISFYRHFFVHQLGINPTHSLLAGDDISQIPEQCYKKVFYALPSKKQFIVNFISCIVCLLSDIIFITEGTQNLKAVEKLHEYLCEKNIQLREHIMIVYTQLTIHKKISKECAASIFNKVIKLENLKSSSFNSRMILNYQMKKIKENMQSAQVLIKKRGTSKKIGYKNCDYMKQIKEIFNQNRDEIQQQRKVENLCFAVIRQQQTSEEREVENQVASAKFKSLHLGEFSKKKPYFNTKYWKNYIKQLKNQTYIGDIPEDKPYSFFPIINRSTTHHSAIQSLDKLTQRLFHDKRKDRRDSRPIQKRDFYQQNCEGNREIGDVFVGCGKMKILQEIPQRNQQSILFYKDKFSQMEPKLKRKYMITELKKIISQTDKICKEANNDFWEPQQHND